MTTDAGFAAPHGRTFTRDRLVRLGDAGIDGRLRLDAMARYLQDVANDDSRDAAFDDDVGVWVVRRTVIEVQRRPLYNERVELTTFLGGTGGRWAERRTTIISPTATAEVAALWVYIDRVSGFPKPVPAGFVAVWGDAGGRKVSGRLTHPNPPDGAERRAWTVRATDFDVLGHMNNAAYWEAVEDEADHRGLPGTAGRFSVEYRLPIEPHHDVEVLVAAVEGGFGLWFAGAEAIHASAIVIPSARS